MSTPHPSFQSTSKKTKVGNFSFLETQVAYWQKLTKLAAPLLPQGGQWQIACYQHGVLILSCDNQALVSKVAYLQAHYIEQFKQLSEFHDLIKIQVRLSVLKNTLNTHKTTQSKQLNTETKQMLRSVAQFVNDPKLSQALVRLASDNDEKLD